MRASGRGRLLAFQRQRRGQRAGRNLLRVDRDHVDFYVRRRSSGRDDDGGLREEPPQAPDGAGIHVIAIAGAHDDV